MSSIEVMDEKVEVKTDKEHWDLVIHPKTGLFDLQLKEIWH